MRDDVKQLVEKLFDLKYRVPGEEEEVYNRAIDNAVQITRQHFASSPASPDVKSPGTWQDGYARGYETRARHNTSGCCCKFNEDDTIASMCDAHKEACAPKQSPAKGETVGEEETFTAVFNAISRLASMERGSSLGSLLSWQRKKLAEAAIAAMPKQESGWQDISTAPKDGTPILAWTHVDQLEIVDWYEVKHDKFVAEGGLYRKEVEIFSGWNCEGQPRYWMPLPHPPKPHASEA